MLDWLRSIVLGLFLVCTYQLYLAYHADGSHDAPEQTAQTQDMPWFGTSQDGADQPVRRDIPHVGHDFAEGSRHPMVHIQTDVLSLTLDLKGGDVVEASLLDYPSKQGGTQPVRLLHRDEQGLYVVQTGWVGQGAPDQSDGRAVWTTQRVFYTMADNAQKLEVPFSYVSPEGVAFTKTLVFHRGRYDVDVVFHVHNKGDTVPRMRLFAQLKQSERHDDSKGLFGVNTFSGGVLSSPEKRFEKVHLKKLSDQPVSRDRIASGWLAMVQHYFLTAVVPPANAAYTYQARSVSGNASVLSAIAPAMELLPDQQETATVKLYIGPEDTQVLETLAPGLERTVDYGWLWPLSFVLFSVLQWIHAWVHNWGVAIVLITLLIKLVFFHLSAKSYRAMAKMKKLQPKIEAIRSRCGDDRQKMGLEMMQLYKAEQVNPLGGCLPILVQIPVFIALYSVLVESVSLRMAPFFGWIQDLSSRDPYFVLPILMGGTMLLQQSLSPPPPDPNQARVMWAMPVVFTALFLYFPSGLVLYWVVNNLVSIAQQWLIMRAVR